MQSVKCVIAGQNPGGVSSSSCCCAPSADRGCRVLVADLVGLVRVWRMGCRRFEAVDGSTIVLPEKDLMFSCVKVGSSLETASKGGGRRPHRLLEDIMRDKDALSGGKFASHIERNGDAERLANIANRSDE